MKTWFTSPKGALTLSLIAMLSLLARSFFDTRFVLVGDYSRLAPGMDTLWIIVSTAIVGGNIVALLAAAGNRQGAWIALLVYNLFTAAIGAAYLHEAINNTFPLVIYSANLVTGALAAVAVGVQLWGSLRESALKEE